MTRPDRLVLVALLAWAPAASAHESDLADDTMEGAVIAEVNGQALHFEDLERLLGEMHSEVADAQRGAPDLDRALFRLVNDTLLAQEARALGLHEEDPIPGQLQERRERLARARLERDEIAAHARPTEEELRQAFEREHRTITFRILTVRERSEAEELRGQIEAGADFEALTRERSVDQYGPRGGLVEKLPYNDMPHELADTAFAMKPGGLEGPLMTRSGWSVLRVEALADADPASYESLEGSLRQLVSYRKAEARRAQFAAELRSAHPVTIDEAVLAALVPERLPDGRLVPKVDDPAAVVARVADATITAEQLGRSVRLRWSGVANEEAARAATPIVLGRMIHDELMRLESLARGLGEAPEAQRALAAYETQLLVARFLSEVIGPSIEVTPEEMRSHYEAHKQAFHRPPRLLLGQVTLESVEEAERVAGLLRQGTDLGWLARRQSIDRYKDAGGERGWVTPGRDLLVATDLLMEAQPGDVLDPQPGDGGYVVIRVAAREEQGSYDFDEVSGNVRRVIQQNKTRQAIHDLIETARERSQIVVHEDVLARLRIRGEQSDAESHSGPSR